MEKIILLLALLILPAILIVKSLFRLRKEGINIRNKLLDYFILGGAVGSLTIIILYSLGTYTTIGTGVLLYVFYIFFPFFMIYFIPCGFLGVLAALLIRKYFLISQKKLIAYLVILGIVYPVMPIILFTFLGVISSIWIWKYNTYEGNLLAVFWSITKSTLINMFSWSLNSRSTGSCMPTPPYWFFKLIYPITGIVVDFSSLYLFRKKYKKQINTTN